MTASALLNHFPREVRRITSAANEAVKAIRALDLKKHRDETGLFVAEGARTVIEALDLGAEIVAVAYLADSAAERHVADIAAEVERAGGLRLEVNHAALEKISRRENPQTVIGVFRQRWTGLADLPEVPRTLVLERVRDPGNLGTILRSADALGAGAVILVGDCTDPYGMDAVRASMGSVFALPLAKAPLGAFLPWARERGGWLVGTHLRGDTDLRAVTWRAPAFIVMGNEQQGLTDALAEACDVLATIPMHGRADSLNLAVATGITLYESVRAR